MNRDKSLGLYLLSTLVAICIVGIVGNPSAHAALVPPYITGISSATEITDGGQYDGWYLYEFKSIGT